MRLKITRRHSPCAHMLRSVKAGAFFGEVTLSGPHSFVWYALMTRFSALFSISFQSLTPLLVFCFPLPFFFLRPLQWCLSVLTMTRVGAAASYRRKTARLAPPAAWVHLPAALRSSCPPALSSAPTLPLACLHRTPHRPRRPLLPPRPPQLPRLDPAAWTCPAP